MEELLEEPGRSEEEGSSDQCQRERLRKSGDSLLGTGGWPLARGRTADDQAGRVYYCVLRTLSSKKQEINKKAVQGSQRVEWKK